MSDLFTRALAEEGITGSLASLARSIYMQESGGGKNTKTSNAGAMGGMQIIPSTFKSVADKGWDINDPLHNARAGIRYLKQLDKTAGGDPALTAAGYYGGPGAITKARQGIDVSDPRNPNAPNTLQYGQQVVARMGGKPIPQVARATSKPIPTSTLPALQVAPEYATASQVPVQEAIPEPTQVAQAPANDTIAAWEQFRNAVPTESAPVQPMAAYGKMPEFTPPSYASLIDSMRQYAPTQGVNFSSFSGFRPKA